MTTAFIPEISDERIAELLKTITPLVRKKTTYVVDGTIYADPITTLHRIKLPDNLRKQSFTWSPEFLEEVDESQFKRLCLVKTYHTTGHHSLAKPSIPEVLAQIPAYLVESTVAFEVCMDHEITEFVDQDGFYGHGFITILYANRP